MPALVLCTTVLAACEVRKELPPTPPLTVSQSEFQHLRWLEGSWRGSGGGIDAFFEGYRWVDDTTIRKYGFADSTLAVISDSGDIALRGGFVRSGFAERSYVVVELDSARARFTPEGNASNGFEWMRTGPGEWTARLTWDSAGVPRARTYTMRALVKP